MSIISLRKLAPAGMALIVASTSACQDGSMAESAALPPPPVSKCVNLGNALEAPNEGDWGFKISDEDIARIAEAGFEAIRLPVRWSAHISDGPDYTIAPELVERVDHLLEQAYAHELSVVLNIHHFTEIMEQPDVYEPQLKAIWHQLAVHFHDHPDTLIFELLNEPSREMTGARMDRLNQELIDQIRETNPDRWLVFGSANWGNLDALLKSTPPSGERLIATFHDYSPFEFTHQGAAWTNPVPPVGKEWGTDAERMTVIDRMERAASFGVKHQVPVFLGEFGVHYMAAMHERMEWTQHMRRSAEAFDIGWCHWDYASAFPVYDRKAGAWIEPMLNALIEQK